ncbi:MAG: LLM class flavin-dependent oxidoreductase [Actinophytocola sp.]|nr:LLM class flavin-dependent oxidoreductase [Actinophytocola sp.]
MEIGVGLPNTTPGATGALLTEWARRADAGPFGSLAVLDRPVYDSVEPFAALSAAAAVTERVQLATMIAIGPLRPAAVLAKQAEAVHRLADGRFTLGLGIGARRDDYTASGTDHTRRGALLSEQLAHLRGNDYPGEVLVGGNSGPAFARMARYADGYAHGGGPPRAFASAATKAHAAWRDLGRPGTPRLWAQGYFALGDDDTVQAGRDYLRDYYAFTGPFAETIASANLTTGRAIKDFVRGYAAEGCDMLVLLPTVSAVDQIDRLAEVIG